MLLVNLFTSFFHKQLMMTERSFCLFSLEIVILIFVYVTSLYVHVDLAVSLALIKTSGARGSF